MNFPISNEYSMYRLGNVINTGSLAQEEIVAVSKHGQASSPERFREKIEVEASDKAPFRGLLMVDDYQTGMCSRYDA